MHILILSTYFKPDIASTGVLMTELAGELALLGHQITVVTSMPHYDGNRIWTNYRGKLYIREQFNDLDVRRVYIYVPQEKGMYDTVYPELAVDHCRGCHGNHAGCVG